MYKYNYIVFNVPDNRLKEDRDGYYNICIRDLESSPYIQVVPFPLDWTPYWLRYMYNIYRSDRVAQYVNLPFKNIWFPLYFKNKFKKSERPLCFIFIGVVPLGFLKFLKDKFPNCKIVFLHRDLLWVCESRHPEWIRNPYLDLEMTFDKGESEKYNFPHFDEFESKIEIKRELKSETDVFFAGKAKDRLPRLLDAYDIFTNAGLKCKYYLTGVPKKEYKKLPNIEYADKLMSYSEMLYHTVNTRCIFEINQAGADGYTSRFLEAVIYGKKLITDNAFVKQSKYYTPSNIQVINDMSEIDTSFVTKGGDFVDYNYDNGFSPLRMIDRVEEELIKKFRDGK